MDLSTFGILWALIERACLVLIIFIFMLHIKFFKHLLENKFRVIDQIWLAIIFGLFAIYGTHSGVQTSGAIANIRNLGPMMGGLMAGPWVGLGAGLIGGVERYFIGGFTAIPCGAGTILSGLIGGLLFMWWKGKIGIWKPTLFAFLMEVLDMALLLIFAKPFENALKLVSVIAMPMILADTFGVFVFAWVLNDMKKTAAASDSA